MSSKRKPEIKQKSTQKTQGNPLKTPSQAGTASVYQGNVFPWEPIALGLLLVVMLVIQEWGLRYEIHLVFALGAALIFVVSFLSRTNRTLLFNRITPVFLIILAHCLLFFAGLFYGSYSKFALQQFFLNIGGFFVFASLFMCFLRSDRSVSLFLGAFSVCVALVSLISIELATSRYLIALFENLAKITSSKLPDNFAIFETNTRVITVIGNPNVFAPIALLATFSALWDIGRAGSRLKKDALSMGLAIICGTTFVLCFSMGAMLSYIPALAAIILFKSKDERGAALFTNLYCLLVSLIGAAAVFALRRKGLTPLLSVLVISAVFALIYIYLKPLKLPVLKVKNGRIKIVAVVAAVVIIAALSLSLRGSYSLSKGGTFRRAEALKPGAYKIELKLDNPKADSSVNVSIDSMSYTEAALKEKTSLVSATLRSGEPLEFTVPSSSAAVFFHFTANSDVKLESVRVTGADSARLLSLRYLLIPEFMVNRMQGIWVNDNAIQRFVFFRDGIRLGLKSPLIGLGGGAFEGGIFSVVDYKYQTKHTHNEYIQSFVDGGILGLALFVLLTIFIFRALIRARRRSEASPLLPFLFGSTVFIFLHSMLEVDFSMTAYKLSAAAFFALTSSTYEEKIKGGRPFNVSIRALVPLVSAAALILAFGRLYAVNITSSKVTLQALERAAVYDPFNGNDYMLSYLVNTKELSVPPAQAREYLAKLESRELSADSEYLLAYYYMLKSKPDFEKGVKTAESYIHKKRVDPDVWDNIFTIYDYYLNTAAGKNLNIDKLNESTLRLGAYLSELNGTLPKEITPKYAQFLYMQAASAAKNGSRQIVADSRVSCDLNHDGANDYIGKLSGQSIEWKLNTIIQPNGVYTLKVYAKEGSAVDVLLGGERFDAVYDASKGCFVTRIFSLDAKLKDLIVKTSQYGDGVYFTLEKAA